MTTKLKCLTLILLFLILDQAIKIWVTKNMVLEEKITLIDKYLRLYYLLNDGRAYAIPFKTEFMRYLFILLKFTISTGILVFIFYSFKHNIKFKYLWGTCLLVAGGYGNLIDRVFHGIFLDNALPKYNLKLFHGRVIDMIDLTLFNIKIPEFIPIIGNKSFLFISPIFNIADLVYLIGGIHVIIMLLNGAFKKEFSSIFPNFNTRLKL